VSQNRFLFPKWTNRTPIFILAAVAMLGGALTFGLWYYATDKFFSVGYEPEQPIPYSHKLHAGDLGIDCRYCHSTVERSAFSAVPPTQVCMNCHVKVKADSPKLEPLRESWKDDVPVRWIKIHNLPDFVYFDHSAHLAAGVGCSTCHGRIDHMVRVRQEKPLTMGWCLDCHRDPARFIRPKDKITDMNWTPPETAPPGEKVLSATVAADGTQREVHPPTHCSGCHR
jgi:hypothetical protein